MSDLARRSRPGLSPAAAHFAELRSFRRGWMAWRAPEKTAFKERSMTDLFFLALGIAGDF